MKKPLSKREMILAVVSVILIASAGIYIINLRQANTYLTKSNTLLKEHQANASETANYIETICAEYRTLYKSYRELRYPDSANVDKHIGLPGSAKGQIDPCYLPD